MGQLTTKAIDAAKPPAKLTDGMELPGGCSRLMLIVRPTRKTWVLRTQTSAGDSTVKVGHYPETSLADARRAAFEIATGARPDVRKKGGTLKELLDVYATSLGERRGAQDARQIARWLLGKEFTHALAAKPAHLIESSEIAELLRVKVLLGKTTSVNRARATLSAAYNVGARHDLDPRRPIAAPKFGIKVNPVTLVPRIAEFEKPRQVVIPRADLSAIWKELEALGPLGAFGRLAMLSLQRIAQLSTATVEGDTLVVIDTKGRGARTKVNVVPITDAMRREVAAGALSLPAGAARMNDVTRPRGLRATDFRRTAETYLSELGYSGEARGYLLSHGLERSALVRAHYDKAQRLAQKTEMLEAWREYATGSGGRTKAARSKKVLSRPSI
jgi:hypothetical protein